MSVLKNTSTGSSYSGINEAHGDPDMEHYMVLTIRCLDQHVRTQYMQIPLTSLSVTSVKRRDTLLKLAYLEVIKQVRKQQ